MPFCCSCTFLPHRISSPSILGLAASRHAPFRDLGFVPNAQKNWSHFPLAILVYKSTVDLSLSRVPSLVYTSGAPKTLF